MQYYMRELDPPLYVMSGRTTRLVDMYVQKLFQSPGEWVNIMDHAEYFAGRKATDFLMERIIKRMLSEHNIRLERKPGNHYLRIPQDIADRLIQFRSQQEQAQRMWRDSLSI